MNAQMLCVLNTGSSSIKLSLFKSKRNQGIELVYTASLEGIFTPSPCWKSSYASPSNLDLKAFYCHEQALDCFFDYLLKENSQIIHAPYMVHRIVHGGSSFTSCTLLDEKNQASLEEISELAPLHNPLALKALEIARKKISKAKHYGVFESAFFAKFPPHVALYPIPYELSMRYQIKRYGFHGISHSYMWKEYLKYHPSSSSAKIITLHLGSGCSLAAIDAGQCKETTMGFTPLDGLMMATRSGEVDPGIIAFVAKQEHKSMDEMMEMLNSSSGLLGVSGRSGDMKELIHLYEVDSRAKLAVDMFIHHVLKAIGSFIAVLGSVDALVFSAGMAENAPFIRERLLFQLADFGIYLDSQMNRKIFALKPAQWESLHQEKSKVGLFVVGANENEAMALEAFQVIKAEGIK